MNKCPVRSYGSRFAWHRWQKWYPGAYICTKCHRVTYRRGTAVVAVFCRGFKRGLLRGLGIGAAR